MAQNPVLKGLAFALLCLIISELVTPSDANYYGKRGESSSIKNDTFLIEIIVINSNFSKYYT